MSDDVFPLEPAHPLAAGAEVSKSLSLLLYPRPNDGTVV